MPPSAGAPVDPHAPIVAVRDLVKRYDGAEVNAVDGVSFDVAPGELFALLGPNGAGKTTTISILTTTLTPSGGTVTIAGHDVGSDPGSVRAEAGIIFQQPSLDLNLTAEENIRLHAVLYGLYPFRPGYRLMPSAYKQHVGELAEVLGIQDELFRPVRTYSGGMKRKLEIIRSLIHRPRVLFLDEPTTGLDPQSRRSLWAYLREVRQDTGTTLFLTTHYLEEAERADTICILSNGKVVSLGAPDDVKGDLVERYLLIDSEPANRAALRAELDARGVGWREASEAEAKTAATGAARFRVDVARSEIHGLLKAIDTPLTVVQTHTPTLEDAYLEIVERTMLDELGVHVDEASADAEEDGDTSSTGEERGHAVTEATADEEGSR